MPHINILKTALTEVSKQINQTKYPEIVFPQFVYVDGSGSPLMDERVHFSADITGDLDTGLITYNTNNFDQVGVTFSHSRTPVVTWAKTVQWQEIELAKAAALGVNLDTQKIMALNQNAHQTLQKVAFLGHAQDTRLKGLLNSPDVEIYQPKATKAIGAMTFEESVQFFEELFLRALEKTYRIDAPNTFAIDAMDYAHLGLLTRDNAINDTTALDHLNKVLSGAAGKAVSIKALPSDFGTLVTSGKHRAIAYINDQNYVSMDVPQSPTVLGAMKKGIMTYESGLKMVFGGVTFKEPQSALYVDY
ncbi:major capsid family protein [Lonepinella koalarum]|uniref:major capsid family protein n=1 Tax=Lonepinella koalarum TaxID=53417 RepID=UPI003F6DE19B